MRIHDFPKLQSPFVRENNEKGHYVVTDKVNPGYEWVFEDDSVMAIEKLHGTNVSIIIENGMITKVFNRTARLPFFTKGKGYIIKGLLESSDRGYMALLDDGQHFGELIGPGVNGNPYKLDANLWIPFETYGQKHLRYKSWGKYPKDYATIKEWFKELMPLFMRKRGVMDGFVEGVVFTHVDGRMAKLRRDMFDDYEGKRH